MGWDLTDAYKNRAVCPCGKGFITQSVSEKTHDSWNHTSMAYGTPVIECEECRKNYHIESYSKIGKFLGEYLVPNGKTLNAEGFSAIFDRYNNKWDFKKSVVALLPKAVIPKVISDMKMNKYSTRVSLEITKALITIYHSTFHTKKLSNIIKSLEECYAEYDNYDWTYIKTEAYLKEQEEVLSQSHKLIYTEKVRD